MSSPSERGIFIPKHLAWSAVTLHSPCLLLRCALVSFLLHKPDRASAWSYAEVMSLSLWHQSVAVVTYTAVQNSVLWHHCGIRQQNKPTPESWLMQHKQPRHFDLNAKVQLHFIMIFFINTARSLSSRKTDRQSLHHWKEGQYVSKDGHQVWRTLSSAPWIETTICS